jgi:hypothetical protein
VHKPNDGLPQVDLLESIRDIVELALEPISEYQLIQMLNDQGWQLSTSAMDSLSLFNSHFIVYNALYHLQIEYWQHNRYLGITALSIQLHPESVGQDQETGLTNYTADQALRDYYLDASNLENATEESVNRLLNDFWKRFVAEDESAKAFAIFELDPSASLSMVKKRYRVLAMACHPDRGGSPEDFQQVNWAFGVLKRVCQ